MDKRNNPFLDNHKTAAEIFYVNDESRIFSEVDHQFPASRHLLHHSSPITSSRVADFRSEALDGGEQSLHSFQFNSRSYRVASSSSERLDHEWITVDEVSGNSATHFEESFPARLPEDEERLLCDAFSPVLDLSTKKLQKDHAQDKLTNLRLNLNISNSDSPSHVPISNADTRHISTIDSRPLNLNVVTYFNH